MTTRAKNTGSTVSAANLNKDLETALANHQAGRLTAAEIAYKKILAVQPDNYTALGLLGIIAHQAGDNARAIELLGGAVALDPFNASFYNNLGESYRALNRADEATACYQKALAIQPDHAEAHNNLGNVFQRQGKPDQAIVCYQKALAKNSYFVQAYINYGIAQVSLGQYIEALENIRRALRIQETAEARKLFVRLIPHIRLFQDHAEIRDFLARAIAETWGRPNDLAHSAIAFIKLNKHVKEPIDRAIAAWPKRLAGQELFGDSGLAAVSDDALLLRLLENTPACDFEMEIFLTFARYALLQSALTGEETADKALAFYAALAQQCFINEYVFSCTEDELSQAQSLRDRLVSILSGGGPIPALLLVSVAAYFPLHGLPAAQELFRHPWTSPVSALLAQQVKEPLEEQQSRPSIPKLTPVEGSVSLLVQRQYEENPYPRWAKITTIDDALPVDAYFGMLFPGVPFHPLGKGHHVEILVAGCGTGQHPITTATRFSGTRVLAIDLSLSSLCYAQRKTRELGIKNIEYAQADIMQLGTLGRTFDIIESSGVLHHLEDPAAGLKILLSLLKPGGFINLGLYSEAARQGIVAARALIAEQGYTTQSGDIRRCRENIVSITDIQSPLRKIRAFRDFFSTSECRDLLFHVQEHRFTLPRIKELLDTCQLNFIGFTIDMMTKREYQTMFPGDVLMQNMDYWHVLETENPDIFKSMYQFWAQKPLDA